MLLMLRFHDCSFMEAYLIYIDHPALNTQFINIAILSKIVRCLPLTQIVSINTSITLYCTVRDVFK